MVGAARPDHSLGEIGNEEEKYPLNKRNDSSLSLCQQHDLKAQEEDEDDDEATASWATMPKKRQLALLTFARFCAALIDGSRQSYIIFQLKSFRLPDGSAPSAATLAFQVSVLGFATAVPQLVMSTVWGILADSPRVGRKRVILIGLVVSGIGSLSLGFTTSFMGVIACRFLVGMAGGNKSVMRAMIKEISGDKFESRAVLLLPTAFNVASVVGPLLGGLLADPAATYPGAFGPRSSLGRWLQRWPYAVPNMFNAMISISCAILMACLLEDTYRDVKRRSASIIPDWAKKFFRRRSQQAYERVAADEHLEMDDQGPNASPKAEAEIKTPAPVSIWTRRLGITLLARGLMTMHIGTYPTLLMIFISTPRYNPDSGSSGKTDNGALSVPPNYHPHAPFVFTGGLSFKPSDIATALAIRGIVGLLLQLLFFPYLKRVFGTVRLYRYTLLVFPITYFVTPYWATVSSTTLPPLPSAGVTLWIFISVILAIQSTARSFALPSASMLLNAASPGRSSLGTVNGLGQSVSSAARTVGPLLNGWMYGVGLRNGVVGTAWWVLAAVAVSAAVASACLTPEKNTGEKRKSMQTEP
ncbi:uncharacterized protein GIQ15_04028 [Arthroderma uncinatum]|uniref:uncharacterized protein n=1 Tax=Arthroderma uncinatum TaxID=74035 RepID=UPI00144A70FA|nr:uncharacterized protein GIQ15_04028 [Arthroderma uncinatum]KAF3481269.1 hypothetical protein GIQ15_04028 [Arthroderma uncinatum]